LPYSSVAPAQPFKKKCADSPYSHPGLPQPLTIYGEVCTLKVQLQRLLGFALNSLSSRW